MVGRFWQKSNKQNVFKAINELGISAPGAYPPAPPSIDFQTLTIQQFCELRDLRLPGLITYRSHTRSKTSTSFGTSHWEALCGYPPSSERRTRTFSSKFEQKVEQVTRQYAFQVAFKFQIAFRVIAGIPPPRVMCGRRLGKNFLTLRSIGRVRSCVRPVCAAG